MKHIKLFENFNSARIPTTHPKFWDFVEDMNWRNVGRYDEAYLIEHIVPKYTKEEFLEFGEDYETLTEFLDNILREVWLGDPNDSESGLGVSDDGWSDVRSSIIGNGKKVFYKIVMRHFKDKHKYLIDMVDNDDYKENFGYVFHNSKVYDKKD